MVVEDQASTLTLRQNTQKFLAEACKRPELARVTTIFTPHRASDLRHADRDKQIEQGGAYRRATAALMALNFVNTTSTGFGPAVAGIDVQAEG